MEEPKLVNGLNVKEFEEAVNQVAEQQGAQHAPKKSRIRWKGGFKFSALVRNHTFLIDEPAHLTGEDEAPNSMEYVLGASGRVPGHRVRAQRLQAGDRDLRHGGRAGRQPG